MKHIILLGKPCSGKGTLSKEYIKRGYHHLSGSDMLRDHISDPNAKYYKEAKFALDNGKMIKDEIINGIFSETVKLIPEHKNIVFDGFPRSISQAEAVINQFNIKDFTLILLDVSDETCIDRLKNRLTCNKCAASFSSSGEHIPTVDGICNHCGGELYVRPDDNVDVFIPKIKEYDDNTKPIIDHLVSKNITYKINKEILKLALPKGIDRVETQPIEFGDDWAGMFIRGDNAMHMSLVMKTASKAISKSDPLNSTMLENYSNLMQDCIKWKTQ
jgi:adenylate kinase